MCDQPVQYRSKSKSVSINSSVRNSQYSRSENGESSNRKIVDKSTTNTPFQNTGEIEFNNIQKKENGSISNEDKENSIVQQDDIKLEPNHSRQITYEVDNSAIGL